MRSFWFIFLIILFGCSRSSETDHKLPFKTSPLSTYGDKIIVPVKINSKLLRFVLDTGMKGSASILMSTAKKIGLKPIPGIMARVAGAQRKFKDYPIYKVDKMTIGEFEVKTPVKLIGESNERCEEYSDHRFEAACKLADGMIGIELLRNHKLYLDLANKKFAIFQEQYSLRTNIKFNFFNQSDILVEVQINGTSYANFLLDTGAGSSDISYELLKKLNLPIHGNEIVTIMDAEGHTEESRYYRADSLCLDSVCKSKFVLMPANYHKLVKSYQRNGIIGFDFLEGKKVIIDFPRELLFLD